MSNEKRPTPSSFTPVLIASIAALALSGCGSSETAADASSTEAQAVTATPATPEETTPSPTESTTSTAATPAVTGDPSEQSSTTPGKPDPSEKGTAVATLPTDRVLTKDDIFMISSNQAEEGSYDVATEENKKGIGIPLFPYSSSSEEMELRLGNRYERLTFNVAQSNSSETSDRIINVEIHRNGESDQIIDVPFNEITPITVDVKDVNALKIILTSKPREGAKSGDGTITAVVYDMKLQ